MQPLWMAVGGATSTRSTHGCGSLGAGGLAWGVCLCLRPRRGARRSSGLGRRGAKRPAAAARQLGAEMNETYGPGTSGGISQDIPGYASLRFLYLLIPGYASFENLSLHIPGYASLDIFVKLIPSYPGISHFRKLVLGYPGISRLAQPVVFPDSDGFCPRSSLH